MYSLIVIFWWVPSVKEELNMVVMSAADFVVAKNVNDLAVLLPVIVMLSEATKFKVSAVVSATGSVPVGASIVLKALIDVPRAPISDYALVSISPLLFRTSTRSVASVDAPRFPICIPPLDVIFSRSALLPLVIIFFQLPILLWYYVIYLLFLKLSYNC